ncbi:hypothetical protein F4821DRAFT_41357 [Hypoxylon rubiginosum]|uniref:Uncharacterized protein n=1 Tax=Hypoxylon rubiginosum TaxID=110542 RepID=A0ACC0CKM8_9PEZI|nr:hypothetical protein F4821DRAFT_41357 [Hypoxylon rubiginosum]
MATMMSPKASQFHSGPELKRPRGILKNSYTKSPPPESPIKEKDLSEKELTIINTQTNAGHRRSSSAASRPPGSRRQSSRAPSYAGDDAFDNAQRLKWDEANLYLTEQERTSTMKITEPKTPYARHYEPSEDDEDEDMEMLDGENSRKEEIPGLSLGEPEEAIPENELGSERKQSKVHVNDDDATPLHDADNEFLGMTPEEREKHRKFEELRKKHYEMRDVAKFLGHPEELDELEEEDDGVPPMPTINGAKVGAGD